MGLIKKALMNSRRMRRLKSSTISSLLRESELGNYNCITLSGIEEDSVIGGELSSTSLNDTSSSIIEPPNDGIDIIK